MAYNSRVAFSTGQFDYISGWPNMVGEALNDNRYQNVATSGASGFFPIVEPGLKVRTRDDRIFMYCEASVAIARGELVEPAAGVSFTVASSAVDSVSGITAVTATAGATIYKDQFRGGYIYVTVGTGIGQTARVISNTAATSGVAGGAVFYLENALTTAISGGTFRAIVPWRMRLVPVGAGAAVANRLVHGVSHGTLTVPASSGWYAGGTSYFGWVQVGGGTGMCEAVKVAGNTLAISATETTALVGPYSGGTAGIATQVGATALIVATGNVFGYIPNDFGASTAPGTVPAYLTGCAG